MKSILIFFILYNVAVARPPNKDECSTESIVEYTQKKWAKITDMIDYFKNPNDDKLNCMIACNLRETLKNQLGKTPYEATMEYIDSAYATGFTTDKFTRKDVESKMLNCKAQEQDDCAFYNCVDYYHAPVADLLLHDPEIRFFVEVGKNISASSIDTLKEFVRD